MKNPNRFLFFQLAAISVIAIAFALNSCDDSDHPSDGHDHSSHDHSAVSTSADSYPLTTCVVSGEPLGSMGEPAVIKHEGTTVKFCCAGCEDDFNENPSKYLAVIAEAARSAKSES